MDKDYFRSPRKDRRLIMSIYTLDEYIHRAQNLKILTLEGVQDTWRNLGSHDVTAEEFFQNAVMHGYLTKYQRDRLLAGDSLGFFYGDYKVQSFLGTGAMGRVYRALNMKNNSTMAIKVLRTRFLKDRQVFEYFAKEAELGAKLQHPNIPAARGMVDTGSDRFIVYNFAEGRTLSKILKANKVIPVLDSVKIMRDVCFALDYAFKRNHTHRDLKLANIIVSGTGRGSVVGFGRDLLTPELESKLRTPSSIDYAALEKLTGVMRGDKRSDLYFLGAVFYHILTGQPALYETEDISRRGVRHRFMNFRPPQDINSEIPEFILPILNRSLCFEPEKRYQTPGALLKDLEAALTQLDPNVTKIARIDPQTSSASDVVSNGKTVMIIEGNQDMHEFYKGIFKKRGYRILIISDPERAVERYEFGDSPSVDCILINAQSLGTRAVDAFNQLAIVQNSRMIPAILMLGEKQKDIAPDTIHCGTRGIIQMPVTVRNLFFVIGRLMTAPVNKPKIERLVSEFESRMFSVSAQKDLDEDETHSFPGDHLLSDEIQKNKTNKVAEEAFAAALEDLMIFTD